MATTSFFTVYSVGDAELMYNAFHGVAMIFNSGVIDVFIKCGFVIGILLVAGGYFVSGRFAAQHVIAALILLMCLFTIKVTVSVEDAYTNEVRPVANIPIGLAAPMSLISGIGYEMARAFETAFAVPQEADMLSHGYLETLRVLLRLHGIGSLNGLPDTNGNGDMSMSILNYFDRCVKYDLKRHAPNREVTMQKLLNKPDVWAALETTFINRDVVIYLPNDTGTGLDPNGTQVSCNDAYIHLSAALSSDAFRQRFDDYLRGLLLIDPDTAPADRVEEALAGVTGSVAGGIGVDAQTYMMNMLMRSYLRDGPSAVIKRTGMEQLKMQWAGEQSIFSEIARPLMAFIETFTIATAPMAAILIVMGPIGFALAARYLQLILWISLWPPVMAICNLYIILSTQRALEAIAKAAAKTGADLSSIVVQDQLFNTLETWVATGGMLAATVPAITLMLVYGAAITATNLAGRMTSGATQAAATGARNLAPDPVTVMPPISVAGQMTGNAHTGMSRYGVAQGRYDSGVSLDRQMTSARSTQRSAMAQVQEMESRGIQEARSSGATSSKTNSVADAYRHSAATSDREAYQKAKKIGDTLGGNFNESAQITNGVLGTLGTPSMMGNSVSANLQSGSGVTASRANVLATEASRMASNELVNNEEWNRSRAHESTSANQTVLQHMKSQTDSSGFQTNLNRGLQAGEAYSEAATIKASSAHGLQSDYNQIGRDLANDPAAREQLRAAAASFASDPATRANWQARLEEATRQLDVRGVTRSGPLGGNSATANNDLATWVALDAMDATQAYRILNKAQMPATSNTQVNAMEPDQYGPGFRTPDQVYDAQDARTAESKSGVRGDPVQLDRTSGFPIPSRGMPESTGSGEGAAPAAGGGRFIPAGEGAGVPAGSGANSGFDSKAAGGAPVSADGSDGGSSPSIRRMASAGEPEDDGDYGDDDVSPSDASMGTRYARFPGEPGAPKQATPPGPGASRDQINAWVGSGSESAVKEPKLNGFDETRYAIRDQPLHHSVHNAPLPLHQPTNARNIWNETKDGLRGRAKWMKSQMGDLMEDNVAPDPPPSPPSPTAKRPPKDE